MDNNALGAVIRKTRGDLSLRDFAKKCNISHTHLDSIEKGYDPRTGKPVSVSFETLEKISIGANINIEDLLPSLKGLNEKFQKAIKDSTTPIHNMLLRDGGKDILFAYQSLNGTGKIEIIDYMLKLLMIDVYVEDKKIAEKKKPTLQKLKTKLEKEGGE